MPPQAAGGGSKSRSTQTVIRGIFVVAAFAVVTLLAGHERMEVSNDRQSGKGHLHHGAVGGTGDALFRRDTYSSPSEHRARPQPQRAHLLGQSGEVEEVGGAGGEELHNALSSLGDELDAAMAEHMAEQYQRQQQQQQQQQGDMHQASRYELRDSSPRAQEGSIPSRLAMPRSQPLRGAIRSPPQPQRAQSSGMEEQQPPGRGDGGLLQKFENKIASMAGGWHVVPPPPSLPQAGAQAQPVQQQQQQQSPRVRVDPPRSAVASPRSPRLSARSVRSPRVNPNSPRQLSEDEIVVKLRGKPYAGNFILNFEGRKPGDMLKQPKHLSEEGQRRRMERGKVAAASRTMKWEHIGILEKLWVEAGVVPASDEVRNRWLRDGPAQRSATCAVVGNGGGLLGMAAGNEIDKHDIVIRFNGGPVQGFQRFVGSKTTYRLTNYDHFAFSDVGDEIILQHMTNINGTKAVTRYSRSVLKKKSKGVFGMAAKDNVAFRVIDPEFHYMLMDLFKYGAPSNGFYGVTLAGEICASVTMYGFQKVWKGTKMPYHYYNDIEPNESQFGRDNNEAIFFQKWLEAVNMQTAVDTDWVQWKSATGWPFSQKFIFAEERHARTLPRLDINLDTVPWVKTGWNQETPNPEYIMSARGGSSPRDLRLSH